MESTSGTAYGVPRLSVVGDTFCVPYPVELIVKKKRFGFSNVHFEVLDVNGNLHLQVDGSFFNIHQKRVMRDPAGFPILTMRKKSLVIHPRWTVHRGETSEPEDFLFKAKQSFSLQTKTRLQVFFPINFNEDVSDFQVVNCSSSQSYKVYRGDAVIAEVNHNFAWSACKGKEDFRVKVYPGVDYAFIVALVVIHSENVLTRYRVYS